MLSSFFKKIFYPLQISCLSTAIFALGAFVYFALSPFPPFLNSVFNIAFYVLAVSDMAVLLYFNRMKSFFETLIIFVAYILLINIKKLYGITYWSNPAYCYLSVLLPLNLCWFFFQKNIHRLSSFQNIIVLLALLIEYSVFENLSENNINIALFSSFFGLNNLSAGVMCGVLLICFIKMNRFGCQTYKAGFFRLLAIFFAFLLSAQISAICLFFTLAAMISLADTIYAIYSEFFYDNITGAFSKQTFFRHANRDFPIRYCVSLTRIDSSDALINDYGYKNFCKLLKMAVGELSKADELYGIYRIAQNMFLLVFIEKGKNEGFEIIEELRRKIAVSEFILKRPKRSVKLTITSAIAEGRRADLNDRSAIITRAYNKMKSSLSQNVTLKA